MKKFFLVLLFCVFPFQVLAGDVSYWADGQIKRKRSFRKGSCHRDGLEWFWLSCKESPQP